MASRFRGIAVLFALVVTHGPTAWADVVQFEINRADDEVAAVLARSGNVESEEEAIFARCSTLGLKLDLQGVTKLTDSFTLDQLDAIQRAAETTVQETSAERGCQIIYPFESDEGVMRLGLYPRQDIKHVGSEGVDTDAALRNWCAEVDPTGTGGEFSGEFDDQSDEQINVSKLEFCTAGVPVTMNLGCESTDDQRCQDRDFLLALRQAVVVIRVPKPN